MGISLEQYRAAVGTFCRLSHTHAVYHGGLEIDPPGVEEPYIHESLPVLRVTWKAAALALLLIVLSPSCLGSLLLIGGVESNPGPVTAGSKKSVLAALCTGAPTNEIRDCLRCYDISKSTAAIERRMAAVSAPNLIATMTYLGVPGQECYVKGAIIRNLVCRIENLLPDTCFICENEYTIAKDEIPLLTCAFCGQGIHSPCLLQLMEVSSEDQDSFGPEEIQKRINPYNMPGIFYICHCCEKEKIPSEDNGKKKNHSNRNDNISSINDTRDATQSIQSDNGAAVEDSVSNAPENVFQGDENENPIRTEELIHRERLASEQRGSAGQRRSLPPDPRQNVQRDRADGVVQRAEADGQRICSFYRKGTCRFGISGRGCSRSHPKPCRRFMQHGNRNPRGCSSGSDCPKFHPRVCSSSLSRGECLNEKCSYPHIKGTRRLNTPVIRSPDRRQFNRRHQMEDSEMGEKGTYNKEDFLSALAVLKMELVDSFERKLQTLQAQIQQVGTADATQFYHQTYRYPQRAVTQQTRQMSMY